MCLYFHILLNTISFSANQVKLYPTYINHSADWLRHQTTHLKHGIVIVLFLCDIIFYFYCHQCHIDKINNTTQKK